MRARERERTEGGSRRAEALRRAELGRRGEDAALAYLEKTGLRLVARNWRAGHLELDLVMESPDRIRFIEVRTLTYPQAVEPYRTITRRKQQRILAAARRFSGKYGIRKEAVFDVVSVVWREGRFLTEYFPDAFGPQW